MTTTTYFDTLFKNEWSGQLTVNVLDNDKTPNRVLDITQPWKIYLRWSLTTNDKNNAPVDVINEGHWRVEAFVESIGTAPKGMEGPLHPFVNVDYQGFLPGGDATKHEWEKLLEIPKDTINEPGIYKVTVMIQYHKLPNVFTEMVGFAEYPSICFNRLP